MRHASASRKNDRESIVLAEQYVFGRNEQSQKVLRTNNNEVTQQWLGMRQHVVCSAARSFVLYDIVLLSIDAVSNDGC